MKFSLNIWKMKYQKVMHIIWVCALFTLYGFSCYDCENEIYDRSSFNSSIIPQRGVYLINDTISLHAFFSPQIILEKSKKTIDLSGNSIGYFFHLFEVKPLNDTIIGGMEKFEILTSKGKLYAQSATYGITLWSNATKDSCGYDIKIIPLEPGYYCVGISEAHCAISDCEYYAFNINNFNSGDSNFRICKEIKTNKLKFKRIDPPSIAFPGSVTNYYFFKVTWFWEIWI